MTTGDLVVAGRNAVEANAGQWALVQELQTAPLQLLIARSADLTIRAGPSRTPRRSPRRPAPSIPGPRGCPTTFRTPPVSKLTVRRFLIVALVLLTAVVLLLTSVGQPLHLPMPRSASDEWARAEAAYAAEQDLEPADSMFSWWDEPDPYDIALRDALLPSREYRKCQFVVVPSFEPEWSIYLLRNAGSAPRLVSRRMSEHLRAAMTSTINHDGRKSSDSTGRQARSAELERLKIEVETSQAIITAGTADVLEAVWSRLLESVRYPSTPWEGEDGVRYHVSHWSQGRGFRSGQTWSPPQGSRPYALVKLSEQMLAFTLTPSTEAEARLRAAAGTLLSASK